MEKKIMKKKVEKAVNIGFAIGMCEMIAAIGVSIGVFAKHFDIVNLADNNGYQETNAIYRQAEIDKLENQLVTNQITPQQFNSRVNNIEDLSVDYYMTGDSVPSQARENYAILKNSKEAYEYALVGCLGGVLLESCVVAAILLTYAVKKENKRAEAVTPAEEPFAEF